MTSSIYIEEWDTTNNRVVTRGTSFSVYAGDVPVYGPAADARVDGLRALVRGSIQAQTVFNGSSQSTEVSFPALGTIPGGSLAAGSVCVFEAGLGIYPVNSATARNLRFRIRVGTGGSNLLSDTTNLAVLVSTAATDLVILRGQFNVRSTGASAAIDGFATMPNRFLSTTIDKVNPFGAGSSNAAVFNSNSAADVVLSVQAGGAIADLVKLESGYAACLS